MRLKISRTTRKGKTYEYAQLVESYRREAVTSTRLHRALDELDAAQPLLMGKLPARYEQRGGAFASRFLDATPNQAASRFSPPFVFAGMGSLS